MSHRPALFTGDREVLKTWCADRGFMLKIAEDGEAGRGMDLAAVVAGIDWPVTEAV